MNEFLPNGVLGIARDRPAGGVHGRHGGQRERRSTPSSPTTSGEPYSARAESDAYYLRFGRIATVAGIVVGIGTALIASGYTNIMDYIQLLFSFFNAPLFATFIIGMFWKRMTPWAGFWGLIAGTVGAAATYYLNKGGVIDLGSDQASAFWGACVAFVADAIVSVGVSLLPSPSPVEELHGLVMAWPTRRSSISKEDAGVVSASHGVLGDRRAGPDRAPQLALHLGDLRWPTDPADPPQRRGRDRRAPRGARANLFDIRRLIGGLFVIYGVILTVLGLGESDASIAKSAGININL